jgi:hypothetical protein
VVSTTLGCEGIEAVSGRDIVLADQADDFTAQVVSLLNDDLRRRQLGQSARDLAERHFDWQIVTKPLERAYER